MSTKKITALTELTTTPAATDMFPVGDVSDTTDAGSGTTKKIKPATVFKAAGIGAGNTTAEPVKIDVSNGRVGVGTNAPSKELHVESSSQPIILLKSTGSNQAPYISILNDAQEWRLYNDGTDADKFKLALSGTAQMTMDTSGNCILGVGVTAAGTSAVSALALANGTAPASSPANMVQLYAEDVSTSELKVRDEAGKVSTLSPHNFELVGERSEPMAWSYANKNVFVGKEVNVDVMKVIRAVEKLTGEKYIKIKDLKNSEKLDWATEEKRKEAEQKKNVDAYKARKAENAAHPTSSSTKADIKAYLDKNEIEYEDGAKDELFKKVPEKETFTEVEPAAYTKKSKPSWIS